MPQPPDRGHTISVIVPVINEQEQLATTLSRVQLAPGDELIVVDGGSTDRTLEIAREFTPDVISSPPGRARQMNLGAACATGDILLFLHADTILPPAGLDAVRRAMQPPQAPGGAFRLVIAPETLGLRLVAWGANVRSRFGQLPYGDQALFIRRRLFEALGGYGDEPFLEDVRLVRAMRRHGRLVLVPEPVQTSGRRWLREGVVYTTVRNNVIVGLFFCGVAPATLKRWYRDWHRQRG
ncbi:MAG: hypothetical protein ETSY2_47570 [Candidatus Entotheonella gemina]|uniref:Glycosyltransferase 2-like domain-containing protein n=1 Tax=Candidatus Entotheonella gemina TaxID=1429439 RepID=W4LCK9_9BACT|nr:MAG: hypothetical protein ETSY2_47570 [Candidatus Entotheonella gemina]